MVPPLKLLRNVVDRMKNIHDYLGITANMGGELTLKVETDMVSIATFYTHLHHPQIGPPPAPCPKRAARFIRAPAYIRGPESTQA